MKNDELRIDGPSIITIVVGNHLAPMALDLDGFVMDWVTRETKFNVVASVAQLRQGEEEGDFLGFRVLSPTAAIEDRIREQTHNALVEWLSYATRETGASS